MRMDRHRGMTKADTLTPETWLTWTDVLVHEYTAGDTVVVAMFRPPIVPNVLLIVGLVTGFILLWVTR